MSITREQRIFLLAKRQSGGKPGLWYGACAAQNWNPDDRELRMAKLSEILGRPLKSTNDIERVNEFTKVKNELLILQGVSIQAGLEGSDTAENDARILRHKIRTQILPCLALYEDAQQYMETVLTGLLRWTKTDRPTRPPSLDDIDARPSHVMRTYGTQKGKMVEVPSKLDQILMTLSARLNTKRKEAGHTIHQMKTMADIHCNCAQCEPRRPQTIILPAEEVTAETADPW